MTGAGLEVILQVEGAPDWAQGPGRPDVGGEGTELNRHPGAWKPDPAAFGDLARALADRYDGTRSSTGTKHLLPKVTYFQAWNEPNLSTHLAPQYDKSFTRLAGSAYRALLNSFHDGLLASGRSDVKTLGAGLSPFGHPVGVFQGSDPQDFAREVLCVKQAKVGIYAGSCSLDLAEPANQRDWDRLAGNWEVADCLFSFATPKVVCLICHLCSSCRLGD
jgi:hypothetical protein